MGGEVSKVNTKSNRIPSNLLRRSLHDMRKRRRFSRPTKQSTPSKKELLSYVIEEDESLGKMEYVIKDMKKVEAQYDDQERVAKLIEAIVQDEDEEEEGDHGDVEDDDNNKDDQRMIKRTHVEEGGDVFPGSPSFRIFFTNNNNVEDKKINEVMIGNKDVIKDRTPIAATNGPTTFVARYHTINKGGACGQEGEERNEEEEFQKRVAKEIAERSIMLLYSSLQASPHPSSSRKSTCLIRYHMCLIVFLEN